MHLIDICQIVAALTTVFWTSRSARRSFNINLGSSLNAQSRAWVATSYPISIFALTDMRT